MEGSVGRGSGKEGLRFEKDLEACKALQQAEKGGGAKGAGTS